MTHETVERQIGNYVICERADDTGRPGARYGVRMAGDEPGNYISKHASRAEAAAAIQLYTRADERRARR